MIGYVARDKDEEIYLFVEEPAYNDELEGWYSNNPEGVDITGQFPEFDDLKYTDNPVKVEIKLERV